MALDLKNYVPALKYGATVDISLSASNNASTIDPSATAESGWINIAIAGTIKYIPYYAAA